MPSREGQGSRRAPDRVPSQHPVRGLKPPFEYESVALRSSDGGELECHLDVLWPTEAALDFDEPIDVEHLAASWPHVEFDRLQGLVWPQRTDLGQHVEATEVRFEQQHSKSHQALDRVVHDSKVGSCRVPRVEAVQRGKLPTEVPLVERRSDVEVHCHAGRAVQNIRDPADDAELDLGIRQPFEEGQGLLRMPTFGSQRPITRRASSSCRIRWAGVRARLRSSSDRSTPCSAAARHAGSAESKNTRERL